MSQLNKILEKVSAVLHPYLAWAWLRLLIQQPSPTIQNQIELTVYIYEPTVGNVYQITCKTPGRLCATDCFNRDEPLVPVEGSTRLSVVRWTVAGALEQSPRKQRAHQSGEFVLLPDDTPCDLRQSISQFAGSGRRCSLRLTI